MNFDIQTENLHIRKLLVKDIGKNYINSLNDYEIVKYTEARHIKWNYDNTKKFINSNNKNNIPFLGIFYNSKVHIGSIRLPGHDKFNNKILLGIMIFDKNYQGKGLGVEALKAISNDLIISKGCNKIIADYCIKNIASKKIFKKSNFKVEGRLKRNIFIDGEYEDSEIVSLIK
jgi:RimJ/RimL family protein N-acetyltransferase